MSSVASVPAYFHFEQVYLIVNFRLVQFLSKGSTRSVFFSALLEIVISFSPYELLMRFFLDIKLFPSVSLERCLPRMFSLLLALDYKIVVWALDSYLVQSFLSFGRKFKVLGCV